MCLCASWTDHRWNNKTIILYGDSCVDELHIYTKDSKNLLTLQWQEMCIIAGWFLLSRQMCYKFQRFWWLSGLCNGLIFYVVVTNCLLVFVSCKPVFSFIAPQTGCVVVHIANFISVSRYKISTRFRVETYKDIRECCQILNSRDKSANRRRVV